MGSTKIQESKGSTGDVGGTIPAAAIAAIAVALLALAAGLSIYWAVAREDAYEEIVIATGPESGTYHALGVALNRVLVGTGRFSDVLIKTTDGSAENMRMIREQDEVDLAFIQADASPSTNARLVTRLFDEVLHIVVNTRGGSRIETIYDLEGARISLGAEGSGTRELSERVLRHFGITPGEDRLLNPGGAARALQQGEIDAAFFLAAVPSRLISELAQNESMAFLPLGQLNGDGDEAHALEMVFPGVQRKTIPRATYVRLPAEPIGTIGVSALLVAREDLDEDLVRDITAIVFNQRAGDGGLEGQELAVARQIREDYNPAGNIISYHPGAVAYYEREEPPFFVQYAEALSLGLTFLLACYSVFIGFREWLRRRMKNRIDAYLVKVEALAEGIDKLGEDQLRERLQQLERLRREAFADLVDEKLLADEAFTILQSHLRDEIRAFEMRLPSRTGQVSPRG